MNPLPPIPQPQPISPSPSEAPRRSDGSGWTLPVLCLGLAVIAACVIIPQADANRRLLYEREKLARDLDQIKLQSSVNEEFLNKLDTDPQLAERLAQRQMGVIRQGETELSFKSSAPAAPASPFLLVHIPPPAPMPAYEPVGGSLGQICGGPGGGKVYLLGAGMFLVAAGLVIGDGKAA